MTGNLYKEFAYAFIALYVIPCAAYTSAAG